MIMVILDPKITVIHPIILIQLMTLTRVVLKQTLSAVFILKPNVKSLVDNTSIIMVQNRFAQITGGKMGVMEENLTQLV